MAQKQEWEKFYDANLATEWYPSESVIRFLCSYKKEHGSKGVRVLDLGCGNGRHVWLAAKEGFSAYGIDLSEQAIKLARAWLRREKLPFKKLQSGDITQSLPYVSDFFDIVVSYGVLDHMTLIQAKKVMAEVKKILKPGGILFLKLEANTSFTFDSKKQVAKNEIILNKAAERGMLQHFFDQKEVKSLVKGFETIRVFRKDYRRFNNLAKNYQSRWIFIGKKK